ncbi:hypothetical protein DCC82_17185 [Geobacillus sp. LYN3]|nr:hypothetical protein DCC82_17185 [Geobacillus sp. LYN3]
MTEMPYLCWAFLYTSTGVNSYMRERLLIVTILILATAFFGEMKINPFNSPFRFSLGSAIFFSDLFHLR